MATYGVIINAVGVDVGVAEISNAVVEVSPALGKSMTGGRASSG